MSVKFTPWRPIGRQASLAAAALRVAPLEWAVGIRYARFQATFVLHDASGRMCKRDMKPLCSQRRGALSKMAAHFRTVAESGRGKQWEALNHRASHANAGFDSLDACNLPIADVTRRRPGLLNFCVRGFLKRSRNETH